MSYCIYLRKSRKDKELETLGNLETLQRHQDALVKLAKQKNFYIAKTYKEVVSGDNIASRPQMQKLLKDVSNNLYKGVLVMEIERLARGNTIDQGVVAETFKLSNTKIITPSKIYDPLNELDQDYFEFGLFMARQEYKMINKRIQRGRLSSLNEGKYIASKAPFGYDKVKLNVGKGYTLKINEPEAKIVVLIYSLYYKGFSLNDIANKLDTLYKPLSSKNWSRSTIKDILTNPVYIGKIRWGFKKENKIYENGYIKKTKTINSNYHLIDGLHKPIIKEDTFYKIQKMFKQRYKPPVASNKELKNPFTNLVFCKKCGAKLTRCYSNTKDNYCILKCPTKGCKTVPIPIYLLEQHLIKALEEIFGDKKVILNKKYSLNKNLKEDLSTINSSLLFINKEIKNIKNQIENIHNLLEQNIYTIDVFTDRHKKLTDKLNDLKIKKDSLIKDKSYALKNEKKTFNPKVKSLVELYVKIKSPRLKNLLLNKLIKKIVYERDTKTKKNERDLAHFNITIYPIFFKDNLQ